MLPLNDWERRGGRGGAESGGTERTRVLDGKRVTGLIGVWCWVNPLGIFGFTWWRWLREHSSSSTSTMNPSRHLLASTSALPSVATPRIQQLPLPLYRLIARQATPNLTLPNPFIPQSAETHRPAMISARRQKQMRAIYPAESLPPSAKLPGQPSNIMYEVGEVKWTGEVKATNKPHGVYGTRKRMFKGRKHERMKPIRMQETQKRMEGMDKRIAEWRQVCLQSITA